MVSGDRPGAARLSGDRLDEYVILNLLGGQLGVVYKAWHVRLKRNVAIKLIPPELANNHGARARFDREIAAAGLINHPNFFTTYDARIVGGTPILVMEYVDGVNLAKLVDHSGPLSIPNACEVARQAALGLDHADHRGLVHRDIKPVNLVVTKEGRVKILDLGLVLIRRDGFEEWMTDGSQLVGTAEYSAPEQTSDSRSVDIRADLYSLGCTLYKLLGGRPPFGKPEYPNDRAVVWAHNMEAVPPLRQIRKDVPRRLAAVIERLLAKQPAERHATAAEVAECLAPFTLHCDLTGLIAYVRQRDQSRLPLAEDSSGSFSD